MLKSWSIENFKPIVNSGELKLAPVTVLAGLNSSGKTSLLQSILMISQTLSSRLLDRPLLPNGPIVQLGTFENILNYNTGSDTITIHFELDFDTELLEDPPLQEDANLIGADGIVTKAKYIKVHAIFDNYNHRKLSVINALSASLKSVLLKATTEVYQDHIDGDTEFIATRLSKDDQHLLLKNVSPAYLHLVPYSGEKPNYSGKLQTYNKQILGPYLTKLSHFLPDTFIQKADPKGIYGNQIKTIIQQLLLLENENVANSEALSQLLNTFEPVPANIEDIIDEITAEEENNDDSGFMRPIGVSYKIVGWFSYMKHQHGENKAKAVSAKLRGILEQELQKLEVVADRHEIMNLNHAVEQITHFFTSKIRYLGPLRADPQSSQMFAPSSELDDVGAKGEYAAAVYEANQTAIIDWYNPISKQIEQNALRDALNSWASYLGVADQILIKSAGYSGFSWQVVHRKGQDPLPLAAVGVGVSQVLPILVMGLLAPKHTLLIIEQPELHLHARVQARLGDFFLGLSRCNKQCLIETHSENLVNQLRYHIVVSGGQEKSDCIIYFVDQDEKGATQFEPVEISPEGNILNWPSGFFDETMHQEDQITSASIRRRGKLAKDG